MAKGGENKKWLPEKKQLKNELLRKQRKNEQLKNELLRKQRKNEQLKNELLRKQRKNEQLKKEKDKVFLTNKKIIIADGLRYNLSGLYFSFKIE